MSTTPPLSFAALGLSAPLLETLTREQFTTPTPIQAEAIPHVLEGKDLIGCAPTGTGKTAAFALPIVERFSRAHGLKALVVAPTRELAMQISEQLRRFGEVRGLHAATLVGGLDFGGQTRVLARDPQVAVATPGRLVDHLAQGTVSLRALELLVLDEADRMLDLGFKPQLTKILAAAPRERQTLLFSATLGPDVSKFAREHLRAPVTVEVAPSGTPAERATQALYRVAPIEKLPLLLSMLAADEESTLVFVRTKKRADKISASLEKAGYTVERLHADRSQGQRRHALEGFRKGKYRVLVSTDIAARGVDVAGIGHVVNYDLPHAPEDYVHRIGRTARASAAGRSSSFCAPDDNGLLKAIEEVLGAKVPTAELPHDEPVFARLLAEARAKERDPGPPQPGHGVSTRAPGAPLGRHARSHVKKAT